jgi:hypothetical protein
MNVLQSMLEYRRVGLNCGGYGPNIASQTDSDPGEYKKGNADASNLATPFLHHLGNNSLRSRPNVGVKAETC